MGERQDYKYVNALNLAVGVLAPGTSLIIEAIKDLTKSSQKIEESSKEDALAAQVARDEARARVAEAMARVQQELAIATRIATADDVMIEEFYEGSGGGDLGLKASESGLTICLQDVDSHFVATRCERTRHM